MKIENYEFKPTGVDGVYICDQAVFKAPFDKDGRNDWEESSGKKLLEQWFREHAPKEIQEQFDIDLPTVEEVFSQKMIDLWGGDSVKGLVSKQFPIFKDSDERMKEFEGKPIWWWTRSAYAGIAYYVWHVYTDGGVNDYYAGGTLGFVPVLRKKDPKERAEMKTLIISNYDGGYRFSVYDDGYVYGRLDIDGNENHKFYRLWKIAREDGDMETFVKKTYGNDYDLIVVCEDGGIEIIKDQTDYS